MFLLQSVADVVNYVSKLSLMVSYLSENCAHIISQIAHQPTTTVYLQFTYNYYNEKLAVSEDGGN